MKPSIYVLLAATALGLAGCNRSNTLPDDAAGAGGFDNSTTTGANDGGGINVTPLTPEEAERQRLLGQLVVYFDYDQADIRPEFTAQLQAHAANLARNPNVQLRLEGHADERGSREYNIGLGQKRSEGVKRMLLLLGAKEEQVESVSLGEEKPRAEGHDEQAWSQNRRSDILYQGEY